jgi:AraC-like DNA-binding protein
MIAITRRPGPPLARFVESIWLYDGYKPDHTEEIHLPDAGIQLVVDLRYSWAAAGIAGPSSRPFPMTTDCQFSVLGVQFRPGGAPAVLGLPTRGMLDQTIALDGIWGPRALEFEERLHRAGSPRERLDTAEAFLVGAIRDDLSPSPPVALAAQKLWRSGNAGVVTRLAQHMDLAPARLMQQFEDAMGLKPKLFQRLHRFQRAVRLIHGGREKSFAAIAIEAGYFDQAHFTHDFRTFAEMSPSAYRERFGRHVNHVPVSSS